MPAPKKVGGYWNVAAEKALELNPPIIQWRRKNNGVWVAVSVHDPHMTGIHNREKTACKREYPFTEDNTIITRDGRQCRTCKQEQRNERERAARRYSPAECTDENLLNAARTAL